MALALVVLVVVAVVVRVAAAAATLIVCRIDVGIIGASIILLTRVFWIIAAVSAVVTLAGPERTRFAPCCKRGEAAVASTAGLQTRAIAAYLSRRRAARAAASRGVRCALHKIENAASVSKMVQNVAARAPLNRRSCAAQSPPPSPPLPLLPERSRLGLFSGSLEAAAAQTTLVYTCAQSFACVRADARRVDEHNRTQQLRTEANSKLDDALQNGCRHAGAYYCA